MTGKYSKGTDSGIFAACTIPQKAATYLLLDAIQKMESDTMIPAGLVDRALTRAGSKGISPDILQVTLKGGASIASTVEGHIVMRPANNVLNREVVIEVGVMDADGSLNEREVIEKIKAWIIDQGLDHRQP